MRARLFLLLGVSLLTGCTPIVRLQSNARPEIRPDFHRILIVSRLPNSRQTYLPGFLSAFPAQYQVCTVEISPISFDTPEEAIRRQVDQCKSEVMLTIDVNRNFTEGGGKYISSYTDLYLELTNIATGQPFWKALITAGTSEINPRAIVQQLQKDGMIELSAPPAYSR